MPAKYSVTTTKLNGDGVHGAWLFIGSPIVQMAAWLWYDHEPIFWTLALIALTGITFLCGFVLLLIGRDYYTLVDENPPVRS
ncbi:hypothetical protein CK228_34090 [Mesorhizobium sp. WSM4312]|nr:hypothetical protein CK228_34090 [Mesorhizobium sp. WSM4312]